MIEFWNETEHTAKKTYKCELCGEEIKPGEKYTYCAGKADGDFFALKDHQECRAVIEEYCNDAGENEYCEEDICDWWQDEVCQKCKKRYVDECDCDCDWFEQRAGGENCEERTKRGKCSAGETCFIMDRGCWCTQFEQEG